jgi:hypothetical protein
MLCVQLLWNSFLSIKENCDLFDEAEDGCGGGDDDGEREGESHDEDEEVVGVDRGGDALGAAGHVRTVLPSFSGVEFSPGVLPGWRTAAAQKPSS